LALISQELNAQKDSFCSNRNEILHKFFFFWLLHVYFFERVYSQKLTLKSKMQKVPTQHTRKKKSLTSSHIKDGLFTRGDLPIEILWTAEATPTCKKLYFFANKSFLISKNLLSCKK